MKIRNTINYLNGLRGLFLVGLVLISVGSNGQTQHPLVKKWNMDLASMRPVIEERLNSREDMKKLDDVNKKVAIETALEQISSNSIEYREDGTYISISSKDKKNGKWKLGSDSTTLIVELEGKEITYQIVSLSEDKLHLKANNGLHLHLMPFKSE